MTVSSDPRTTYAQRRADRGQALGRAERRDQLVANLRLAAFLIGLVMLSVWLLADLCDPAWLTLPVLAFVALAIHHESVLRAKKRATDAVAYYDRGVARLEDRWVGSGVQRDDFAGDEHPYADDVDLFGRGSLFELLCTARTRAGEETLARWLLNPADRATIAARQEAVDELRTRLDLREELALEGGSVRTQVHPDVLIRWGEAARHLGSDRFEMTLRIIASVLAVAAIGTLVIWAITPLGPAGFIAVVVAQWVFGRWLKTRLMKVVAGIQQPSEELAILAGVLKRLEQQSFDTARLLHMQRELISAGSPASTAIRNLQRLVAWMDAQRNQVFAPIAYILMWNVQFGVALERWRRNHGANIRPWLEALGELEALCSLAGYAFENPEDPFASFTDAAKPQLNATGMGHPLVPRGTFVRNDVHLDTRQPVLLVSGSNMSGKSTLLRTIGINVVLAHTGAPVRARSFVLSELSLGATLRIHDSLQGGTSRFYAELKRLSLLVNLTAEPRPLLFLLDEIFHGTNSHDRQVGAQALIRALIDAGAIGLVTTHDLALAEMADQMGEAARNVHFADEIRDGELHFDYVMREGVVQKSNAIDLMRRVGLPV